MRRKVSWAIAATVIIITVVSLLVFRTPAVDVSQVHPSLASLGRPYQSVETAYFMDGGSVGVQILGRDGKLFNACLPRPMGEQDKYKKRIFMNCSHYQDKGAIEVAGYPHTGILLRNILVESKTPHLYSDRASAELTGAPRDWAIAVWRRFTRGDEYLY